MQKQATKPEASTPSGQLEGFFIDEDGGVWMRLPSARWTLLGLDEQVCWDEPGKGLVLGSWRATRRAAASSWLLEASVVLASASFWFTLLLRGKQSSRLWRLSWGLHTSTEAFRRISFPEFLARAVRTWKKVHYFLKVSNLAVPCPVFGCFM